MSLPVSDPFAGVQIKVWTIGHSTRSFAAFLALLEENRIEMLADVRHFPTSQRAPWTQQGSLAAALRDGGIDYEHIVELGGYRKATSDSKNLGWKNASFRGYADYMSSRQFSSGIERLIGIASKERTAIMCAEAVPWRCHRSLVSDSLVARGINVVHILSSRTVRDHRLTAFAKVRGHRVTYPGARKVV